MTVLTTPRKESLWVVLATGLCVTIALLSSISSVDAVVSIPLALYLPGAALVLAIDPVRNHTSGVQRQMWSLGASIGILIAGGFVLNVTGGLTRRHWIILISAVVLLSVAISWMRRAPIRAAPGSETALSSSSETVTTPPNDSGQTVRKRIPIRQGSLVFGALIVVAGALLLSIHTNAVSTREHFVQAWILTKPQDNPWSPAVEVGVTNHEGTSQQFVVLEQVGGTVPAQPPAISQQVIVLKDGQGWGHNMTRKPGEPVKVTVALSSHPNDVLDSVRLAQPVSKQPVKKPAAVAPTTTTTTATATTTTTTG
jgi:uncharacterized membrane protein